MGQRIDQFCQEFRGKLAAIESGLQGLSARIENDARDAEPDVRNHLARVRTRIEQGGARLANAQTELNGWIEHKKICTSEKLAEWERLDRNKLAGHAAMAERCVAAAMNVAAAALDAVEQASLEAWLARRHCKTVQPKQTDRRLQAKLKGEQPLLKLRES